MPTARRYLLSVAPVPMVGITATSGPNTSRVACSIGPITSGVSGEGAACSIAGAAETWTPVSPIAATSPARTSAGSWPGAIRQFTFALAAWGSAFRAWPPVSIVATQVVREHRRRCGVVRIGDDGAHRRTDLRGLDRRGAREVGARHLVEHHRKLVRADACQRRGQLVDRVVVARHR